MERETSKFRVLHIMRTLDAGGIGMFAMNILRECNDEKIEFDFAVAYNTDGAYGKEIKENGGKIYYLLEDGNKNWKDGIVQLANLNKLLKKEKFDVIHCHYYFANALFLLIAKMNGIKKRVSHCHNTRYHKIPAYKKVIEEISKLLLSFVATDMIGCSDAAKEFLYRKSDIKKGKAITVYNGINYNKWNSQNYEKSEMYKKYNIDKEKINFIFVGRLEEQKNPLFMLEVFQKIHNEKSNTNLTIIGYGTLEQDMKYKVKNMGLNSNVKFLKSDTNVAEVMNTMDCMLAPSLWEGLSIAFIEAQAMGVQVFTSDLISKEVDMGLCNFLPLQIDTWLESILQFLDNREKRLNKFLVDRRDKFDIKNTVKSIMSVYGTTDF